MKKILTLFIFLLFSGCSLTNVYDARTKQIPSTTSTKQTSSEHEIDEPLKEPQPEQNFTQDKQPIDKIEISRNAVTLLLPQCEQGDMKACNDLGVNYEFLSEDELAFQAYKKSCDGAVEIGCANLGNMHENGKGTKKDPEKAIDIYKTSCNNGGSLSCYNLANIYRKGEYVKQDYYEAHKAYKNACELGDITSCASIGSMYELGLGVTKDEARAHGIYKVACYRGLERACSHMKRLGIKLGIR
ncbi:tetratricopeptide repeat protein [Campylobacter sp. 9BO]|uniref:tetratricopeptide repeat protein n=1 Tax=Campylobacter sp. 9BO TaxID=3424759 RepID=UPI003D331C74